MYHAPVHHRIRLGFHPEADPMADNNACTSGEVLLADSHDSLTQQPATTKNFERSAFLLFIYLFTSFISFFLVLFVSAVGCPLLSAPEAAHIRYELDKSMATVICNHSNEKFVVRCTDRVWSGVIQNCTILKGEEKSKYGKTQEIKTALYRRQKCQVHRTRIVVPFYPQCLEISK